GNPWNFAYTPGGSSGGEAAAIASGMSAGGVGSDGGGSIRVPAHFTGLCGLKPTPGRIPATGHFPASVGPFAHLGVVGPMSRTVGDLECMLAVMSGADIGDPLAAAYPLDPVTDDELRALRIGFFADDGAGDVCPETQAAVHSAAAALRDAGLDVEPFLPDGLNEAHRLWQTLFVTVAGGMLVAPMAHGRFDEISGALR